MQLEQWTIILLSESQNTPVVHDNQIKQVMQHFIVWFIIAMFPEQIIVLE